MRKHCTTQTESLLLYTEQYFQKYQGHESKAKIREPFKIEEDRRDNQIQCIISEQDPFTVQGHYWDH